MQKMMDYQKGKLQYGLEPMTSNPNKWADSYSMGFANTDIYDELYKKTLFSQEHNLSVSGGNENVSYYASGSYMYREGQLKMADEGNNRIHLTGKVDAKITDWLRFHFNIRFVDNDIHGTASAQNFNYIGRHNWPNMPNYDPIGH